MAISDEDLLLINCVMYDPTLGAHSGQTLDEWAASFDWAALDATIDESGYGAGGMTRQQWEDIVHTVQQDADLGGMTIAEASTRYDGGNRAVITDPATGTAVVAFQGTTGDPEWTDNGDGGHIGVTDTPDQMAALEWFESLIAPGGVCEGYDNITTTGHSKGGNLAMYVAITADQYVDSAFNVDGQGFNAAALLKYRLEIARQGGNLRTYASAADFVNMLFTPVAPTTYTEDPGLTGAEFPYNHAPIALLEIGADGLLHMRPTGEQSSMIAAASSLLDYLHKFASGKDFALLCTMAMGLKTGDVKMEDVIDMDKVSDLGILADGIVGILARGDFHLLKEPYQSMFENLWVLIGNFYKQGGMTAESLAAIKALLQSLIPLPEGISGIAVDVGGSVLGWSLSQVEDLPYSTVLRDFSTAAEERLKALVDQVTPREWYEHIGDFFTDAFIRPGELDFSADDAAREVFYRQTIDKADMSRTQIEQIFDDVRTQDHTTSLVFAGIKDDAENVLTSLRALLGRMGG